MRCFTTFLPFLLLGQTLGLTLEGNVFEHDGSSCQYLLQDESWGYRCFDSEASRLAYNNYTGLSTRPNAKPKPKPPGLFEAAGAGIIGDVSAAVITAGTFGAWDFMVTSFAKSGDFAHECITDFPYTRNGKTTCLTKVVQDETCEYYITDAAAEKCVDYIIAFASDHKLKAGCFSCSFDNGPGDQAQAILGKYVNDDNYNACDLKCGGFTVVYKD